MSATPYLRSQSLGELERAVEARLDALAQQRVIERIWARDPAVWGGDAHSPELGDRLGWLDVADRTTGSLAAFAALADEIRARFDRVVLCGMGGSSLAPEALWRVHGARDGYPRFTMLDSTSPRAVKAATPDAPERACFVVASKSGGTVETRCFLHHFWAVTGGDGSRFVAITDPGSPLEATASERGFRSVLLGDPEVGGRFSALSAFGVAPAALFGADMAEGLRRARIAQNAATAPPAGNVAAWLGVVLGEAALAGRDKLTLILSPSVASLGPWVEQLVAESTGKGGRGILPVLQAHPIDVAAYGADRLVVSLALASEPDARVEASLDEAARRGHPTVRLTLADTHDVCAEFYRWQFATAVAGAVLGVNPFDQPDVEESKANTRRVLDGAGGDSVTPGGAGEAARLLGGVRPGDYVAIQAYVAPDGPEAELLPGAAAAIEAQTGVPVTVGWGPRYLHSTGQLHKGGPATGHFLQVVEDDRFDLPVPAESFTFGALLRAQADGDLAALRARGRACVRVTPETLRALASR